MDEILSVKHLKKYFTKKGMFDSRKTVVKAADNVSFAVKRGEVFVLAGESGSGKSTIARLILRSIKPDSGSITFDGMAGTDADAIKKIRMGCQMIHQDPYDSINPRMKIEDIVSEPLEIHGIGDRAQIKERVLEALAEARLEPAHEIVGKYPHMLSGGQRQRVVLARALATRPKMILADEPVSMLDVSIRAEMLELLQELQARHGISFMYITHDLATARHFGQRIAILYRGTIVETGPISDVLSSPLHPYTQALIDAVSEPDPGNLGRKKEIRITENAAHGTDAGCRFAGRCPYVVEQCRTEPELEEKEPGRLAACHVRFGQHPA